MQEYALYKGEDLEFIGTLEEIAKHRGIKISTVQYYSTKSHKERLDKMGAIKASVVTKI